MRTIDHDIQIAGAGHYDVIKKLQANRSKPPLIGDHVTLEYLRERISMEVAELIAETYLQDMDWKAVIEEAADVRAFLGALILMAEKKISN